MSEHIFTTDELLHEWERRCRELRERAERAESELAVARDALRESERVLDTIEAMLVKKKRMATLFDVQQIRARPLAPEVSP